MAGMNPGAHSAPTITRTRTCHGAVSFGACPCGVYTSRREGDARISVDIAATDGLQVIGRLSATQARSMARALLSAADAVDVAQRRPTVVRGGAA